MMIYVVNIKYKMRMPVLSKHLLLKLINCVQTRARLMAPTPELLAHECC